MKSTWLLRSTVACLCLAAVLSVGLALTAGDAKDPLVAAVQPFVDKKTLAGAVMLVADKDKILATGHVGFADIENNRMMAEDTVFWIASQSKPITAAGLMLLVDEGKIRLDDPVSNYLPEFAAVWVIVESDKDVMRLKRPARPIKVRDLLNHTSGLPFQSAVEGPARDALPLHVAVRSYATTPLQSEPGAKYLYSNAGINTVARIVEVVAKMPFEKFIDQRIFMPLGMTETTFWPTPAQEARLATAYQPTADKKGLEVTAMTQLQYPLSDRKRHIMPAGGYFSTASDVAKFCQMMLNRGEFQGKRILSEAAVDEMTKRQTPEGQNSYGLGFDVGPGRFGHGGAFATNMNIDTKRGLITVWLVQHRGFPGDGDQAQGVFRKAAEAIYASVR